MRITVKGMRENYHINNTQINIFFIYKTFKIILKNLYKVILKPFYIKYVQNIIYTIYNSSLRLYLVLCFNYNYSFKKQSSIIQIISEKVDKSYWIGAEDMGGSWKWIDGSPVKLDPPYWATYCTKQGNELEPVGGDSENCLVLDNENFFYFNDMDCFVERYGICEIL